MKAKQKKYKLFLALAAILLFASCTANDAVSSVIDGNMDTPTWQEQYDLGLRYLSEGNYQEAIIAFTAAIEIDPKRAEAYSVLADAYIGAGRQGAAIEALNRGYAMTGSEELNNKINELGNHVELDALDEANSANSQEVTENLRAYHMQGNRLAVDIIDSCTMRVRISDDKMQEQYYVEKDSGQAIWWRVFFSNNIDKGVWGVSTSADSFRMDEGRYPITGLVNQAERFNFFGYQNNWILQWGSEPVEEASIQMSTDGASVTWLVRFPHGESAKGLDLTDIQWFVAEARNDNADYLDIESYRVENGKLIMVESLDDMDLSYN